MPFRRSTIGGAPNGSSPPAPAALAWLEAPLSSRDVREQPAIGSAAAPAVLAFRNLRRESFESLMVSPRWIGTLGVYGQPERF
jgi:hypothetical protein